MWWIVAAVVLGGTAISLQAPINAALARELGGPVPAAGRAVERAGPPADDGTLALKTTRRRGVDEAERPQCLCDVAPTDPPPEGGPLGHLEGQTGPSGKGSLAEGRRPALHEGKPALGFALGVVGGPKASQVAREAVYVGIDHA